MARYGSPRHLPWLPTPMAPYLERSRPQYAAVLNKFTRIAKNPSLKMNPSDQELAELDAAQDRFDKARLQMDIIINEIRKGARI